VAADQGAPAGIATDGADLYWANTRTNQVMRMPLGGGAAEVFATVMTPADVAFASGYVFVASVGVGLTTLDSTGAAVANVGSMARSTRVLVAGNRVLFNDTGDYETTANGSIYVTDIGSDTATALVQDQEGPEGMAVVGSVLYWANTGSGQPTGGPPITGGGVFRMPLAGGSIEQLDDGTDEPFAMAADSRFLYFTRRAEQSHGDPELCEESLGSLWAFDLQAMTSSEVASGLSCPSTIAVDSSGVYFVTNGMGITTETGTLVRVPKL
jgi:sugar lactone lactonase YvrE